MSVLFDPCQINSLVVPNRFVRSATAESACRAGYITAAYARFYENLSRGGMGLILTGHASATEEGRVHEKMTGIHDDRFIPALRRLNDAVHKSVAVSNDKTNQPVRIAMQINHREIDPPQAINTLNSERIERIVQAFADAACRVKDAGFDAVQIHCAHGFLISQFLDPHLNRRVDRWAGTEISEEILRRMRVRLGPRYPVLVKMNCDGLSLPRLTPQEGAAIAQRLVQAGADAIEVSGAESTRMNIKSPEQEGYFAEYAQKIRETVDVPVILVGGLRSMQSMEKHVLGGTTDFVALCRPLIREPNLVRRFREQHASSDFYPMADCISCSLCWSSPELLNRCGVLEKNPESS